MRDKLYNTRERMRQLLATGKSDIPTEDTFTDASQVSTFFATYLFFVWICNQNLVTAGLMQICTKRSVAISDLFNKIADNVFIARIF